MDEFRVNEFAERLRKARIQKGLTVKELAKHSGMSADSIYRFECGIAVPNLSKFQALLQILEVEPDTLLCDSISADKVMLEDELYTILEQLHNNPKKSALGMHLRQIARYIDKKDD